MDIVKQRLKSKTYWLGATIGVLGIVETKIALLQSTLGEWYGLTYIGIAGLTFALRELTKEPLSEKTKS